MYHSLALVHAQVGRGTLLEAILPVLLPMHQRRPSRALVLAALGPGARARPDLPLKALQEQVSGRLQHAGPAADLSQRVLWGPCPSQ